MDKNELQFHLKIKRGDVGTYCILPGDPARCERIAEHFDDAHFVAANREFTVYTGSLNGTKVSVCSTGIGGPSAAIAMEELCAVGVDTFIRVGTSGGIALEVKPNDCVIATGAVRHEGTSREYAPIEYPAVADAEILFALIRSAEKLGYPYHAGVVQCKDSFYGQHSPQTMSVENELTAKWEQYKRLGVLVSEMESAALFTVAANRNVRCGTVLHVIWNQERQKNGYSDISVHDTERAIEIAVDALSYIIEKDKKNQEESI